MKTDALEQSAWKDRGIFAAWIAGTLLIGSLLWFITQPLRNRLLQENVNTLLAAMGQPYSLEAVVSRAELPETGVPLGTWYHLRNSDNRALVFALMSGGIRIPCIAFVSSAGKVTEIVPLNTREKAGLGQGIRGAYIRRIEQYLQEGL